MKSRTSFCNGAALAKDLGRFAPAWVGYTICLLLGMLLMMNDNLEYWFPAHMATMTSVMAVVNCFYALLTARLLFGDLWNTRMCHGLHAMPLTRQCWFHTHVAAGLLFSLVPCAVMAGCAIPVVRVSTVEQAWQIPLYFLLGSNLQYLFFFGLAVFTAMCSGNWWGMAVIYGIANVGSYLAYFLVDTLVTPLYYGAVTTDTVFKLLCPAVQMAESTLVECERHKVSAGLSTAGSELYDMYGTFHLGDGWLYLVIVALVGLALLALARGMYCRRRLECAGDFLATAKLAPVFMVLFSVAVGTVLQFVQSDVMTVDFGFPLFLYVGVAVGWFAGRMLLERQVAVFRRGRTWLGLALLLAVLAGGLYGLRLDPLGVEDWVPRADQVKRATITGSYRGVAELKDREDIETVIRIHRGILEDKLTRQQADEVWQQAFDAALQTYEVRSEKVLAEEMMEKLAVRRPVTVHIEYVLNNGFTVNREYLMWVDTEAARLAKPFFSQVSAIFNDNRHIRSAADLQNLAVPQQMYLDGRNVPAHMFSQEMMRDLADAIVADSQAGTLVQTAAYHPGFVLDAGSSLQKYYSLDIQQGEDPDAWYLYFTIYADSENCLRWMEEYGLRELADSRMLEENS